MNLELSLQTRLCALQILLLTLLFFLSTVYSNHAMDKVFCFVLFCLFLNSIHQGQSSVRVTHMGFQNTPADVVVLCLTDGRVRDATCMQAGSPVCLRFIDPKCIQPNKHEMQSLLEEKESYK